MLELSEPYIQECATRFEIPAPLLYALVMVESGGDTHAWRVEPPYRYLVDVDTGEPFRPLTPEETRSESAPEDFPHPKHSSRDTEWWGQQCSWGPMQVMGAVAREYGFRHPFPVLCSGAFGIEYGAKHLHRLALRFLGKHHWEGVVAAYNAGSPRYGADGKFKNQRYVDKVRAQGGFNF